LEQNPVLIPFGVLVTLAMACSGGGSGATSDAGTVASLSGTQPIVGCATSRPAIAHEGGAMALSVQPASAPIPCSAGTGYSSVDTTLVITASGKILFGPANIPGLTSSSDQGMTWATPASLPAAPGGDLLHPWLWQDSASHRIFYNVYSTTKGTCADGSGATLWYSDDEGSTWTNTSVGCGSHDWGKVVTGPAATASAKAALAQSGYPDMVFYCATGPTAIIGPDHICYRSVDGGKTFTETATDPVSSSDGYPTAGAVGPDGTFYVPKGSPDGLAIAMSTDEGDTFNDVVIPGSAFVGTSSKNWLSLNVTTDSVGNIYAVWSDDKDLLPYIAVSKDKGATWSAPIMIGAPGVKTSAYPNVTVKSPGYIAVEYYGSEKARTGSGDGYFASDGLPYSAYLVVTTDLFGDNPVFWSAVFNDPSSPVFTGLTYNVSEYAGYPVFAADGTIWAAYLDSGKGLAARLAFPPSEAGAR
jgi:hypothetical protein